MSESAIVLSADELHALTGYEQPTKQLRVLHARGFTRAFIGRRGVVLERSHYEAVTRGEQPSAQPAKRANLSFLRAA